MLLLFDYNFSLFSCPTYRECNGKLIGKAPLQDLFVGRWKWNGPGIVRIREDGAAIADWPNAKPGKWKALGSNRYEVNWDNGAWLDTMRMESGDKELTGVNLSGRKLWAARVISPEKK
jgi:hypothetical protein